MTAPRLIPAAAPARVRAALAGGRRAAQVVHRGADAVYLEVDGRCLGVLSAAATAVPCALRTTLPTLPAGLREAERVHVGGGRVTAGHVGVHVGRTVDPGVPPVDPDAVPAVARRLDAAAERTGGATERLRQVRAELPEDALSALAGGRAEAVAALLGRGSGLTPVGDDVLAGWLATARAAGERDGAVACSVAAQAARTTLLSATLLDCAFHGEVLPEHAALLRSLVDDRGHEADRRLAALLGVGHTSGAGLALGTRLALHHLQSRSSA